MSDAGDGPPQTEGGAPVTRSARDSRSERRSVRRHAQRKRRAERLFSAVAPALLVLVAVAVLFPLLVSPGPGERAGGATPTAGPPGTSGSTAASATATTAPTAPAGSTAPTSPGSPLLVIEQDGTAVTLALVFTGPNGGVVLGVPALSLLRSGDRFIQLSRLYGADGERALAQPVADALAVPVGAVASARWNDLRDALAGEGIESLPPAQLDAKDGNAAQVSEALAAAFNERGVGAGEPVWKELPLAGDGDGFRATVGAALLAEQASGWVGRAVTGGLVDTGHLSYFEPDIATARSVLAGTGEGG
jgi:hypothetical protein